MAIPGFRFYPTEEELITFYLKHKIEAGTNMWKESIDRVIPELNVYDFYPSDLPQYAGERCKGSDTEEWYFFIPRQENEARGGRQSRLTKTGYWKATGSMNTVYSSSSRAIGIRRTMVFYNGRAPTGTKTKWMMKEYNAFQDQSSNTNRKPTVMKEFSVCRVYVKSNRMRAFDRRPSGVMINEQPPVPQPIQNNEHHATTLTTGPQLPLITTGLSAHSQDTSDDQAVIYHPRSRPIMESNDPHFWDWDELARWL